MCSVLLMPQLLRLIREVNIAIMNVTRYIKEIFYNKYVILVRFLLSKFLCESLEISRHLRHGHSNYHRGNESYAAKRNTRSSLVSAVSWSRWQARALKFVPF